MELNIEINHLTGSTCCYFEVNGKEYYADKHTYPFLGDETEIFVLDKYRTISDRTYCDRSGRDLEACIKLFINKLKSKQ